MACVGFRGWSLRVEIYVYGLGFRVQGLGLGFSVLQIWVGDLKLSKKHGRQDLQAKNIF